MSTLVGRKAKNTFKDSLHVENANAGLDTTFRAVEDGLGNATKLQLSSGASGILEIFRRITASDTLVLADKFKIIEGNHASTPIVVTIPPFGTIPFEVGVKIYFMQYNLARVSVAAGVGVTIRSSSGKLNMPGLTGRYCMMWIECVAADEWYLHNGSALDSFLAQPDLGFTEFDDFMGGVASLVSGVYGPCGFSASASGTGASLDNVATGMDSTENAIGVARVGAGTATTGRCRLHKGTSSILLGQGHELRMRWRACVDGLSDGTNTYTAWMGFNDVSTSGEHTDAVNFRYTHSVNSGKWQAVTRNNGTETATALDTGVAPTAGVFDLFEIYINSAGTLVQFFINGTQVAGDFATNIPTGAGRQLAVGFKIEKTAGAVDKGILMDWYQLTMNRTAAR